MKEFRYSRKYKIILAALHQVFAVALISLVIVGIYYEYRYNGTSDVYQNKSFMESNYFGHRVQEEIMDVMEYVDRRERFEVNGVYDPEKVVDIVDYVDRNRITGTINSSVGYTIDELLTWCKAGVELQSIYVYEYPDGTYDYYTAAEHENIVWEDELYGGWQMEAVVEKYAPRLRNRESESLLELARNDTNVNGNLEEYYYYLQSAISKIEEDLLSYREEQEKWNTSNLTFLFQRDGSNAVCTNNVRYATVTRFQKNVDEIRTSGEYVYIDTLNMELEQGENLSVETRSLYDAIQEAGYARNGDYVLCVRVDTSFAIRDNLYDAQVQYQRMRPWFRVLLIAALISVIGFVVCLIELSIVTGRKKKDGEIQLNWFDRLYTEFAAFLSTAAIATILIPVYDSAPFYRLAYHQEALDIGFQAVMTGGCVTLAGCVALGTYLSIVRRIKVKNLWSRSLTGSVIRGIKGGIANRRTTTKTFLGYILFLLFNFLALLSGSALMILAVMLDIWVGAVLVREAIERNKIAEGVSRIAEGNVNYKIDVSGMRDSHNRSLGININNIGEGLQNAVEESTKNERLKTDLITNVSHDIKTPLTSIINYVDLLKREDIEDEKIQNYINILEQKSQRLKHLTEDLVEASKISSGNIKLEFEKINFIELVNQTDGEFSEKFAAKNLEVITNVVGPAIFIYADGRRIWRVLENLYNNAAKYAMENTRVYVDVRAERGMMEFSIKNISEFPLNIQADELTERFIRGDVSRSTEGSGLGLSIARNLTELQNGQFEIYLDGDLFKVIIRFPRINP